MKKRYLQLLSALLMLSTSSWAQCPAGRFVSDVFPNITMTTVEYSPVYHQMMDIYQPTGDTMTARPLIILAHGGSFITGNGDRTNDPTVDTLCTRLAKRGYVTVSIDYRTTVYSSMVGADSTPAINEVIMAISDGKAAIRYFMKDRATANTYKIDTNNIFVGGNSAGAVLYMHVGYLDSIQECPSHIQTAMAANGGFEGNSGNAGYTTRTKGIINLAGALNSASFIGPGNKPSVNCQGDADPVVPYSCGFPLYGFCSVTLCGLGTLEPAYAANGIYHMSKVFPGDTHVPWSANIAKMNSVDSIVTLFLYTLVCSGSSASVNEVNLNPEVKVFPNPASGVFNIAAGQTVSSILMYDETGRTVLEMNGLNKNNVEISTQGVSKGIYFVRIRFSNGNNTQVMRKVVIE